MGVRSFFNQLFLLQFLFLLSSLLTDITSGLASSTTSALETKIPEFLQLPQVYAAGNLNLPSKEKSSLEVAFLDLPAFDVVQISPSGGPMKVGDVIPLKVIGLELPGLKQLAAELTLEVPPAETTLHEQGWDIQTPRPESETPPTKAGATSESQNFFFNAIPLKSGNLTLPSLVLKDSQGKNLGRTNPLSIQVTSAIMANDPQPEEPEQLEPPVGLVFPIWFVVATSIVTIVLIGAMFLIFRKWLRNRRAKFPVAPKVVQTADETALRDLFLLEQKKLIQQGHFKIYYFTISEILKAYLGRRFQFDATESTTQEVLDYLERSQLTSDQLLDRLESLFIQLDRVKFTDFVPNIAESLGLLVEAREWIQLTRQAPTILAAPMESRNAS